MLRGFVRFSLIVLLLAFAVHFQNCSVLKPNSSQSDSTKAQSNGGGYDGKIFVHLRTDGICPDGTLLDARIQFSGDKAILNRENCADLSASQQHEVSVVISPSDPSYVVYQSMIFVDALVIHRGLFYDPAGGMVMTATLAPTSGPSMQIVSKIDAAGQPVWSKRIESSGNQVTFGQGKILPSGEFLLTGSLADGANPARYGFVAKTDIQGNVSVVAVFAGASPDAQLTFTSIDTDPSGNFYITGLANLPDDPQVDLLWTASHGVLLKLSPAGGLIWSREIQDANARFSTVQYVSANEIYVSGGKGVNTGYLARMSDSGDCAWSKTLYGVPVQLSPNPAGGVLLAVSYSAGTVNDTVVKIAGDGSLVWAKSVLLENQTTGSVYGVSARADGSMLLSGEASHFPPVLTATTDTSFLVGFMVSLDGSGALQWGTKYSPSGAPSMLNGNVITSSGAVWLQATRLDTRPDQNYSSVGLLLEARDQATQTDPLFSPAGNITISDVNAGLADTTSPVSSAILSPPAAAPLLQASPIAYKLLNR